MANEHWPEPKRAKVHYGEIEYRDIGEGPVLVFLHLVLADESHWDLMPPLLADRYRCIFPTLPMGAHRVPTDPGSDLSAEGLARAIHELVEHLGADDVTVVGNDSGGAITQVMAVNYPERIGRVVLTNCDMYDAFPPPTFAYFNIFKVLPPASFAVLARTLKIRALWRLPIVFGRLTNDVDATKINRWADAMLASPDVRRDLHRVFRGFGPDVTNEAAAALRTTKIPFLVAWGADDKAFKPALAERFVAEVPTAELVMIPDCKTFVCWDQPERLAELIDDFVTS